MWYFQWYVIVFLYFPVFVFLVTLIRSEIIDNEIKYDKRYKIVKIKKPFFEKVFMCFLHHLYLFTICLIPLYNVLFLLGVLLNTKMTESIIKESIEKGTLIKVEEQK